MLLPLQRTPEGHIITQFTKETVEDIGLLKMDILGLRTLTVISRAVNIIERTRGVVIDLDDLPLDDPAVYQLLSREIPLEYFSWKATAAEDTERNAAQLL
jgi:DNA polymerase-3 subunit alpha